MGDSTAALQAYCLQCYFFLFMIKLLFGFFITTVLFSCTAQDGQTKNNLPAKDTVNTTFQNTDTPKLASLGYYKIAGDSLIIPSFEIEVSLSQKANDKLKNSRETIILDAAFTGFPKDSTSKQFLEEGEFYVAFSSVELRDSRIAKFEGIKFSKARYDSLADKDISVGINIYSGRKSSKNNLLDCEYLDNKMSFIKNKKFIVKGKLIGE